MGDRPSYESLWAVRLGPDGRASAFTEWFMERKLREGMAPPPISAVRTQASSSPVVR
jgi:hypothetical protein